MDFSRRGTLQSHRRFNEEIITTAREIFNEHHVNKKHHVMGPVYSKSQDRGVIFTIKLIGDYRWVVAIRYGS